MDELDELLGFDESNPQQVLARDLTEEDYKWVRELVELRKRRGLSQTELGRLMGRTQSVVSDIESMTSDPRLSTLRRYALAVGAHIRHEVADAELSFTVKVPRNVHHVDAKHEPDLPRTHEAVQGWATVATRSAVKGRPINVRRGRVEVGV
ncbi:helix-turn-helix transcriptional regulator [Amycolatopsis sp. K13G38]|uniref:Helix-turn-helix transcriptional regulator n=1 Tax=Amycolatopsis acididurans TaxID=2724524 RepID=A0ABX1J0M4_9PSEU|nr:helix-turn-helix transcriptional regulator [Amycolatopsis acididurans]NKQ53325.1 helix-turn-helix transcriptional regulator [Amycolatopsis acididurans]